MPRKSQAHLKTVEVISHIQIDGEIESQLTAKYNNKIKMWMRAWIADCFRPQPHSRVSYMLNVDWCEKENKYYCFLQVFGALGFFQASALGKDLRESIKNTQKEIEFRIKATANQNVDLLPLPVGAQVAQAS